MKNSTRRIWKRIVEMGVDSEEIRFLRSDENGRGVAGKNLKKSGF